MNKKRGLRPFAKLMAPGTSLRVASSGLRNAQRATRNSSGFTLVELAIVVAIMGMIVLVINELLLQANQFFILNRTRIEMQQEARGTMNMLNHHIREAKASSMVVDQVSGQPYYSRLTFTDADNQTVRFYQEGKIVYMQDGTNVKKLSENVRYLVFAFPRSDDLTLISVSLTLEKMIYIRKRQLAIHMASEKIRVMNP
ncbi:MAG: type II secretion system protein [Elusimicrobia bacterium]|nr:type II secretion system protein [Elusimicrobiota bacterium]